jgi:catechol 2,3-dioxygenase-like lactoylglutathione lyase family enzyme
VLHHVSLEIPPDEADRSIEFWGLLGFEEVPAAEVLGDRVRWLEREGTQIHLILTAAHTAPMLGHAAVVAPDHAEAKERLRGAGFQVEDTRQLWGADRAFAIAPGGHRVELMAAPPPPKQD